MRSAVWANIELDEIRYLVAGPEHKCSPTAGPEFSSHCSIARYIRHEVRIQGTHTSKRKTRLMQRRRGFTLIEVLIVITIVGILLGVVVPRYGTIAGAMGVHSAKQEIGSMLAQGRATAIQTDQKVLVVRAANVI